MTLAACGGASGIASSGGNDSFVIATDTTVAPFEFTDESNDFVGIDADAAPSYSATAPIFLSSVCILFHPVL